MITKKNFGSIKGGREVTLYSLTNSHNMRADVMDFGAILVNLEVPNSKGELKDVVMGFDKPTDYQGNASFFGATVGPVANRTAGARYTLNGEVCQLDVNEGENNLHSHYELGLHKRFYTTEVDEENNSVTFTTTLEDGELGMPGNRMFQITYLLAEDNGLEIHYHAESDKDTVINLTNHSYFNLKGHDHPSIEDEKLWLKASSFVKIKEDSIPTGEIGEVENTPFDFTKLTVIGSRIEEDCEQIKVAGGYDHNFVINNYNGELQKAAMLVDEAAGRTMEVYTDLPGIQFYAGNFIADQKGKAGSDYTRRAALALETQYFPNCANEPNFERPIAGPGRDIDTTTIYKFV